MRVGADHGLPGYPEALHVGGVGDTVAGFGEPEPEAGACRPQILVVFGVLLVGLQQVVIDILDACLGPGPVQPERLEFLHHQRAGGVLGQRLVDAQRDLLAGSHLAGFQMCCDELTGDVLGHDVLLRHDWAVLFGRLIGV